MRVKKRQLKEKIEKRVVLKSEIPIMRLHRHGADEKHHTATVSRKEKNPEIKG